ncbi:MULTISPECIES: spermidine synthase [Salinibaculum]|uniref:spermidine synthase n=1 Tax=Salinibaculum TaxID=2732368 RepID=UPI0030D313B6
MSSVPDSSGLVPSRVEFAVFVSGVASMGLEIVAGRQLAPTFGSSVYTWGSIIGVFLAALALGYWIAGRRAARRASTNALAVVLIGAALYVGLLLVLGDPLLQAVEGLSLPPRLAPILPITILFGPPTVLLGFISPYGAELVESKSTGDASGRVYALGTAGSIVGAFATTFLLVPSFGVVGIEFAYGLLLLVTAAVITPRRARATWTGLAIVTVVLLGAFAMTGVGVSLGSDVVYETQTQYQQLRVVDDDGIRTLYLDGVPHSAMDKSDPDRYVFEYTRYFHLSMLAADDVDRVLFVGGGGFSGPKRFVKEYDATVDVVEIDPAVIRTAKEYFDVTESPQLRIHNMDAREYIESTDRTYDVIILDAYRADRAPIHLTTAEFMQSVSNRMDDDGVVVANVISAREGGRSAFYRAQYKTMDRVFPQVYSFPTSTATRVQNIELVATNSPENLTEADFARRNQERAIGIDLSREIDFYQGNVSVGDAPLLTDDFAPVDSLLARQVDTEYVIERTGDNETAATP